MLKNTLLVVGSVVVALGLCEAYLRLRAADVLPQPELYELDADVGKRMKPGWVGSEFGNPVRVNSHGLRSPETTWEKPPAIYRILALGDSWTFGFRMDEAHSYPRQLERILNERLLRQGATGRVEVINAGVVGYSTAQEAAYFRLWGHRYQPDLVLLAFYPVNDTEDKLSRYARYHRLRSINPWLLEIYTAPRNLYLRQFWKGMRRKLKQEVAAARLSVAQRLGRTDRGAEAIVEADWTYRFDSEYEGWGFARRGLREIGETAREIGAEGLVVLLPDLLDIARYEDRYHPRIAPLLRAEVQTAGLDWLDLVEVFQPFRDREEAVRMKLRRHPNAEGYRLIAESVAASVERRYRPVGLGGSGG